MRCRKCSYILDHLPEPRCPECGTRFDADDPTTFVGRMYSGRDSLRKACLALLLLNAPWVMGLLLFVMMSLPAHVAVYGAFFIFPLAFATVAAWIWGTAMAYTTLLGAVCVLWNESGAICERNALWMSVLLSGAVTLVGLLLPILVVFF